MRVLLVDDEPDVVAVIVRALAADGHDMVVAGDLAAARASAATDVDMLVLDIRLPDGSGIDLCRELRAVGWAIPILVLTASDQVALRVEALDAGADDFLAKPFAIAELRARVRALGRRGALVRDLVYVFGDVRLDFAARRARRADKVAAITAKEWSILEVLANHSGRTVATSDLVESVWGKVDEGSLASLQVFVARLRRKLGIGIIRTQRGDGYALAEGEPTSGRGRP